MYYLPFNIHIKRILLGVFSLYCNLNKYILFS
nr:MAG TPA: hypothetical protein [Caudoviricetes sp.]